MFDRREKGKLQLGTAVVMDSGRKELPRRKGGKSLCWSQRGC